jgi:hypothetical protein
MFIFVRNLIMFIELYVSVCYLGPFKTLNTAVTRRKPRSSEARFVLFK